MAMLITWSLPTPYHRTAGPRMLVKFVWQGFCCSQARFSLSLKCSVTRVIEQEAWELHMWRIQQFTGQTKMTWNWCFKPLTFCQDPDQSLFGLFCVVLQAFLSCFARLATGLPCACRMLCIFICWIPGGRSSDYFIKEHFIKAQLRNFSVQCAYTTTILVLGQVHISPGKSHVNASYYWK